MIAFKRLGYVLPTIKTAKWNFSTMGKFQVPGAATPVSGGSQSCLPRKLFSQPVKTTIFGKPPSPSDLRQAVTDKVTPVADLLRESAIRRELVHFSTLHALVGGRRCLEEVKATVSVASQVLASPEEALYESLIAVGLTELPSEEFFQHFRLCRGREYLNLSSGDKSVIDLGLKERLCIAELERRRVFSHARGVGR